MGIRERLAKKVITPIILRILNPYTGENMGTAIKEKADLAQMLRANPSKLYDLQRLASLTAFQDEVVKGIKDREVITNFINNDLQHSRPDLYVQIKYSKDGTKYIVDQVRNIADIVFL